MALSKTIKYSYYCSSMISTLYVILEHKVHSGHLYQNAKCIGFKSYRENKNIFTKTFIIQHYSYLLNKPGQVKYLKYLNVSRNILQCFRPWKYLKIFRPIEIFNKCFKYFLKYLKHLK